MTITTDSGNTFEAAYAFAPAGPGDLRMQIRDGRPLSELAALFEGCQLIHRASKEEGDADYDGYTVLKGITRFNGGDDVQIVLAKEGAA